MPKVSVIIPVYRVEKYIEKCAVSLFEQTLDDIEYLFVDDCSPDNSIKKVRDLLSKYPKRESQVVFHRMGHNSGQAKVREWGVKHSKGEFIIHCDPDDWVDTDLYQFLYEKAIYEKADIVGCDYCVMSNKGDCLKTYSGFSSVNKDELLSYMLLLKNSWSLCNKLIKSDLYGKLSYYPKYNMGEDMLLVLQFVANSKKIAYLPNKYYYYFHNQNSITYSDSYERILLRYRHCLGNTELVHCFFKDNNLYNKYSDEIVYLDFHNRSLIKPALYTWSNWRLYFSSSWNSNCQIMRSKYINAKDKLTHLFILSGLYPIVLRCYKLIKKS